MGGGGAFECNWVQDIQILWPVLQVFVNILSCNYGAGVVLNILQTSRYVLSISLSLPLSHAHTHTHTSLCHTSTSNHQDLDFILFIRPVEEGDAGVLSKEGGGS